MLHHIAFIPDGNRRWALDKGLPEESGALEGAKRVVELVRYTRDLKIFSTTFWGFSTENWTRSPKEVQTLMMLFEQVLDAHINEAIRDHAKITHLGRKDRLSDSLRNKIISAEAVTKNFNTFELNIALDYGGRDELVRAFNTLLIKKKNKVTEKDIQQVLDTKELKYPNPDIIVRTSGEKRLSGFMPFQSIYSELIFIEEYFPDFTTSILDKVIEEYKCRVRKFGK